MNAVNDMPMDQAFAVDTQRKYNAASDCADRYVAQRRALLVHSYGNSGDSFQWLNDELQDNYLSACADMVDRIAEAVEQMDAAHRLVRDFVAKAQQLLGANPP